MPTNVVSEITFSHPRVRITHFVNQASQSIGSVQTQSASYLETQPFGSILTVGIKPNQLTFSYGLNTQSYPTYAGEVVQILSAYIDNLNIQGDVRTYADMELIYKWFISYMTVATQGVTGKPSLTSPYAYDDTPISMSYPHRNWLFSIRPISLPTLTYGTDVVVPSWTMEAAIVEDENMQLTTMANNNIPAIVSSSLEKLDGNFANVVEDPFNYFGGVYQQQDINRFLHGQQPIVSINNTQLTNWYHNLVAQYASGNVDLAESSVPFSKPFPANTNIDLSSIITAGGNNPSTLGNLNLDTPPTLVVPPSTSSQYPQLMANGIVAAPTNAPSFVKEAIAAGNQINSTPYVLGGGHGGSLATPSTSYDCSSSTSYVLFYAGILGGSSALDSAGLASWGSPGPGQWITVYANPASGENGHAFLFIGDAATSQGVVWDTVPGYGLIPPGSGPRWQAGSTLNGHIANDDPPMIARHYPGY